MSGARSIVIDGTPAPKGSKSAFVNKRTGRAIVTDGDKSKPGAIKLADWKAAVRLGVQQWLNDNDRPSPLTGPVTVQAMFRLPKPASKPKWKWLPDVKPDLDKLLRSTLDGLSKLIYADDGQVVSIHARKVYAIDCTPGAVVTVSPFTVERDLGPTLGPIMSEVSHLPALDAYPVEVER